MSNKRKYTILGIVVVLLIAILGGYMYYKRTPTYTFNLIKESVEKHDYETFSKHVDSQNLISAAYDDAVDAALDDPNMDDMTKGLAGGFIKLMKPGIVAELNDELTQYVKTGETKAKSSDAKKENDSQKAGDNIKEQTNIDKLTFKRVGDSRDEDGFRITGIVFEDKQLGKEFTLEVKMKQLDDGTWQVLKIANLKQYIQDEEKARKEKLAELNQPIRDEINKEVEVGPVNATIVNKDFVWNASINIKTTITLNSDKAIAQLNGNAYIVSSDGKSIKVPIEKKLGQNANQKLNLSVKHDLNPFISGDDKIIKNGLSDYKISISIDKITYADGDVLKIKDKLD